MSENNAQEPVLLVDSTDADHAAIAQVLKEHDYSVRTVRDTVEAMACIDECCALLIAIPTQPASCSEFVRAVRERSTIPIIVVHAQDGQRDGVAALEFGADDYVCGGGAWLDDEKLAGRELIARLGSALRSAARDEKKGDGAEIVLGAMVIKLDDQSVWVRGAQAFLTRNEVRLLIALARANGSILSHEDLLNRVWGPAAENHRHYLHVHISRLRQRLETSNAQVEIRTHYAKGYSMSLLSQTSETGA